MPAAGFVGGASEEGGAVGALAWVTIDQGGGAVFGLGGGNAGGDAASAAVARIKKAAAAPFAAADKPAFLQFTSG